MKISEEEKRREEKRREEKRREEKRREEKRREEKRREEKRREENWKEEDKEDKEKGELRTISNNNKVTKLLNISETYTNIAKVQNNPFLLSTGKHKIAFFLKTTIHKSNVNKMARSVKFSCEYSGDSSTTNQSIIV